MLVRCWEVGCELVTLGLLLLSCPVPSQHGMDQELGPLCPPGAEEPEGPSMGKPKVLLDTHVDNTLDDPIPRGAPAAEGVPA